MNEWVYRVVKDPRLGYAVHSVCLDDNGDIEAWNDLPLSVYTNFLDSLQEELQSQLDALDKPGFEITRKGKLVKSTPEGQ